MAQRYPEIEGSSGVSAMTPGLPPWLSHPRPHPSDRRAKMLEHMARARSLPQRQAGVASVPLPSGDGIANVFGDVLGHAILFGVIALLVQSRIPPYLGAFIFLNDDGRIERTLAALGIRLEPETIGADIVKRFPFWFGFFALLGILKGAGPAWLAPWMPPAEPWSSLAAIGLLLAVVEASSALAMRRALPLVGLEISPSGLTWATIQFALAVVALALLVQSGFL